MELRRSLTGGLAWAGLVIVVAVPTVEAVRSKLVHDGSGAVQTVAEIEAPAVSSPAVVPTVVASAAAPIVAKKPAVIAQRQTADVAVAPPMVVPTAHISPRPTTVSAVAAEAPVASVAAREAPKAVPSKASALPVATVAAAAPVATTSAQAVSEKDTVVDQYLASGKALPSYIKASPAPGSVASTPPPTDTQRSDPAPAEATEIASTGDGSTAATTVDATTVDVPPPLPMPVAARPKTPPQRLVTEADLKGWKSGSLADYLRQRGLLSASDAEAGSSN